MPKTRETLFDVSVNQHGHADYRIPEPNEDELERDFSYQREIGIEKRFRIFHAKNPEVYETLKKLAFDMVDRGHKKIGIAMLYEVMRWKIFMETEDESGFKLSNDYRSRYARLLMTNEPRLFGVFETRELRSETTSRGDIDG